MSLDSLLNLCVRLSGSILCFGPQMLFLGRMFVRPSVRLIGVQFRSSEHFFKMNSCVRR